MVHNNKSTLDSIEDIVSNLYSIENDTAMEHPYIDEYTTTEQKKRDKLVTDLLGTYLEEYKYKHKSNKAYKGVLFGVSTFILLGFSISFVVALFMLATSDKLQSLEYVIELVSICVTFLALIVGILKIIARYVFPKKEEEYITKIVELIQTNDLKNKQENIRVKGTEETKTVDK